MDVVLHPADLSHKHPMVAANPCAICPKLWLHFRRYAFLSTGCAEHNVLMIFAIGVGQGVSRLQRSEFYYSRFPALPGWATAGARLWRSIMQRPHQFLSWVIECSDTDFSAADCAEWLEGRLPRPVEDLTQWEFDDAD
jgi:hypothetical protein